MSASGGAAFRGALSAIVLVLLLLSGCSVSVKRVSKDVGRIRTDVEEQTRNLGPAVYSLDTDGTVLNVVKGVAVDCRNSEKDTIAVIERSVADRPGLFVFWGLSAAALGATSAAFYTAAQTGAIDTDFAVAAGTGAAITGGVDLIVLFRNLGRLKPPAYKRRTAIRHSAWSRCHTVPEHSSSTGTLEVLQVQGASPGAKVDVQFDAEGRGTVDVRRIPPAVWGTEEWQTRLTLTDGKAGPPTAVPVTGDRSLAQAESDLAAARAEQARMVAQQQRKAAAEQEARLKAEAAERAKLLAANVDVKVRQLEEQECDVDIDTTKELHPRTDIMGRTYYVERTRQSYDKTCERTVPAEVRLHNRNPVGVHVELTLLIKYTDHLMCKAESKSVKADLMAGMKDAIPVEVDTYQGGFFLSGNCELLLVSPNGLTARLLE